MPLDLDALEKLYDDAITKGFDDQLYGILTADLVDVFPALIAELRASRRVLGAAMAMDVMGFELSGDMRAALAELSSVRAGE